MAHAVARSPRRPCDPGGLQLRFGIPNTPGCGRLLLGEGVVQFGKDGYGRDTRQLLGSTREPNGAVEVLRGEYNDAGQGQKPFTAVALARLDCLPVEV